MLAFEVFEVHDDCTGRRRIGVANGYSPADAKNRWHFHHPEGPGVGHLAAEELTSDAPVAIACERCAGTGNELLKDLHSAIARAVADTVGWKPCVSCYGRGRLGAPITTPA